MPAATAPGGLEGRAAPSDLTAVCGPAVGADARAFGTADHQTMGSLRRRRGDRGGAEAR